MRSGRCRRQPKATLRLYKPRQMAVCLYSLGPSDAGRIFRNAHVRISRACRPLRQGEHPPLHRRAFACQAASVSGSFAHGLPCLLPGKANHRLASCNIFTGCYKSIVAPSYYGEGYLPRAFFAEGKERKKGRTAMKKRGPFAVFLFHLSAAFLPCDQTVCLHHTACGAWEQSSAQKRNLFSERKVPWNQTIPWNSGAIDGT